MPSSLHNDDTADFLAKEMNEKHEQLLHCATTEETEEEAPEEEEQRASPPRGSTTTEEEGVTEDDAFSIRVEPLPLPTRTNGNPPVLSRPGAYARGGVAPFARQSVAQLTTGTDTDTNNYGPTNTNTNSTNSHEDDDVEQPAVIDGAVLVEEETEVREDTPGGDGSGPPGQLQLELVDATAMPDPSPQQKRGNLLVFVAVFLVAVLVATGLAIGLTTTRSSRDDKQPLASHGNDQTAAQEAILYAPFREDLKNEYLNGIADASSYYYLANVWMRQDPYLNDYSFDRQMQRFNMAYFYYASHGDDWYRNDDWLSYEVSECDWFMKNSTLSIGGWKEGMEPVPACDSDNHLVVLNLTSNNLYGQDIATSKGLGQKLKIIDLGYNRLYGAVPSAGANAEKIEIFVVSSNNFTGLFRGNIVPFGLRVFKTDGNQLFGVDHAVWRYLPALEVINTTGNLYDEFSKEMGLFCKNLTQVVVGGNPWIGPVPPEWGLLPALQELDFSGSSLVTGTIPPQYGLLTNLRLLDISGTSITGEVPESLCFAQGNHTLDIIANCSMINCCSNL